MIATRLTSCDSEEAARDDRFPRTVLLAAQVICVTPVRNEAWILERFLTSASLWADRIVVADQGSEDASRDIALRFPKVTLLENPSDRYDEVARQRLLIDEARATPGRRLIVALDADEALTWRSWETEEWDALRHAPEGTVASFEWVDLLHRMPRNAGYLRRASPSPSSTTAHRIRVR